MMRVMKNLGVGGFSVEFEAQPKIDPRWQIAIECAGQAVWEVDRRNNSCFHSPAWFKMRGLDPCDLQSTSSDQWESRIHPEDLPNLLQTIRDNEHAAKDTIRLEYRERHSDGHWIHILSQGRILSRDANGIALHDIGTDTDVTALKIAEQRLSELSDMEKRWRTAVECADQGLWDVNNATQQHYYSDAWRKMRGLSPKDPVVPNGPDWFALIHPDDHELLKREFDLQVQGLDTVAYEYRQRKKNGDWVWIMSRGRVVERDADGKVIRAIGTDTDITALKKFNGEMKKLSHRYELAVTAAKVGVWEYDLAERIPTWDANTKELFGVSDVEKSLPADIWDQRIHPEDRERVMVIANNAVKQCSNYATDYRIVLPNQEVRHLRCRAVYHEDKFHGPSLLGVNWDVTQDYLHAEELKRAKELAEKTSREIEAAKLSVEHTAIHDALTGLPNRRHLDNVLRTIDETKDKDNACCVALMHVDLDRFKQINDTLGHLAGDAILCHVSKVLTNAVGGKGVVCRSGGDEFQIVLQDTIGQQPLSMLASLIVRELSKPVIYNGHECLYGASIGIAIQDQTTDSARALLINADIALYQAKSEGRNRFCFFTRDMQQHAIATKQCADDIRRGLERGEFFAVYQLQFDARTRDVIGVEALARWNHPVRGVLSPDAFLQVAYDINAVAAIDECILEQSLAALAMWRKAGLSIPCVSVNISARRLSDAKLIEGLRKLDIPADSLSFELLESIYLDDHSDIVAQNIAAIKALGIGIEIDDFGTGHASIACLLSLRPTRLKIDRQLVSPIVSSVEARRLLASIVDIGQALGIEVLAEGVETLEHARILADLDCGALQGFALARPLKAEDIGNYVSKMSWRKVA
jgi:diguanylate cyclase (GGDEF)-like protein/PAS domain S-box-containing protein